MAYTILKVFHLLAVVLFLGNIYTGLYWMRMALQSRDIAIIHHTIKGIMKSDRLFTVPGVIFIVVAGILTAAKGNIRVLHTGWILWSILLFTLSGIAFMSRINTLQKRIYQLSDRAAPLSEPDWTTIVQAHRQWQSWGLFALITPLLALVLMTLKVPL